MALTDNLISYWKCDEASGNLLDAHGSNTGTDTNTVGSGTGKIGNGRSFNGSDEHFVVADNASTHVANFTISAWINPTDFTDYNIIINRGNTTQRNFEMDIRQTSGKVNIGFTTGPATYRETQSVTAVSTGVLTHVVGTYDGANLKIYINGSLDKTTAETGTAQSTITNTLIIGSADGSVNWFYGIIDELGLWSRAITSTEVTELYNSGNGLAYPFTSGQPYVKRVGGIRGMERQLASGIRQW